MVERDKTYIPDTHIHDLLLSYLGKGTSMICGGVQLV